MRTWHRKFLESIALAKTVSSQSKQLALQMLQLALKTMQAIYCLRLISLNLAWLNQIIQDLFEPAALNSNLLMNRVLYGLE